MDRSSRRRGRDLHILTTTLNNLLSDIHDRMPVILHPADYASWLDPAECNANVPLRALVPYAGSMRRYPVALVSIRRSTTMWNARGRLR